ncbi:MAG: hypothetical protein ACRENE_15715 [Polyangiaceae bacterium]
MKRWPTIPVLFTAATLAACGSLDANTDRSPALATIQGSVINPTGLPVNGSVRVAVVWRIARDGQFNVAEDLPVQPVFPSSFTIQLDGPPPADVMNSDAILAGPPADGPEASVSSTGSFGGDDGGGFTGDDSGGLAMQSLHLLGTGGSSSPGAFAVGTVVAYVDRNGNGKLDLVAPDAGAYIDQVVATNVETSIVYFEGTIPSAFRNARGTPVDGYNLYDAPPCVSPTQRMQAMVNPLGWPPNHACPTNVTDAGPPIGTLVGPVICPQPSWLSIDTPFVLTVATAPEISQVACVNGGPASQPAFTTGSGGAGPADPSIQPATYPDPCDPDLSCSTDGSSYFYSTCTTVNQGLCLPSYMECTSVQYARPTTVPAGWPCIH